MPADLAALAMTAVVLTAGFGILAAVGQLPTTLWRGVCAAGLAYCAGLAATLMICVALLCAGMAIHAVTFVVVCLALGAAGITTDAVRGGRKPHVLSRSRGPRTAWRTDDLRRVWPGLAVGIVLTIFVVLGYRLAEVTPLAGWDSWSIWARKAILLFDFGHLPTGIFTSPAYTFMHPDYPLLVPMLESVWFRFVSGPDTQSLHIQFWLLFVASLSATAYIASRMCRPAIWAPLVGFIAIIPAVFGQLSSEYADIPMCLFLLLGVLLLGTWLRERRGHQLVLAILFLAAAASTKNEGLTAAVSVLVAAGAVAALQHRPLGRSRDLRLLSLGSVAFLTAIAPWRVWLAIHHISGDMPIGKGLDPRYVIGRASRIPPTLTALYDQVTTQGAWHYVLPLAIALVIASIVRGARWPAAFYGLAGVLTFLSLIWAYTINENGIQWYLATSASRTVDGVMFVAIAALLGLTGDLASNLDFDAQLSAPGERSDDTRPSVEVESAGQLVDRVPRREPVHNE
jgi:hypothetical protein